MKAARSGSSCPDPAAAGGWRSHALLIGSPPPQAARPIIEALRSPCPRRSPEWGQSCCPAPGTGASPGRVRPELVCGRRFTAGEPRSDHTEGETVRRNFALAVAVTGILSALSRSARSAEPAANTLKNSGFGETGTGGLPAQWTAGRTGGWRAEREEGIARTGKARGHIVKVADGRSRVAALVFSRMEVVPGNEYTLSGRSRSKVSTGRTKLLLDEYDRTGTRLGDFLSARSRRKHRRGSRFMRPKKSLRTAPTCKSVSRFTARPRPVKPGWTTSVWVPTRRRPHGWWLLIRATEKTTPGECRGVVTLAAEGLPAQGIGLPVEVWPVTLPRANHYGGSWGFWRKQIAEQEHIRRGSAAFDRRVR